MREKTDSDRLYFVSYQLYAEECGMIVTFCGHAQLSQNSDVEKWLYTVTEKLIEQGAASFYLGGYGDFDSLAASVLKNQKNRHPQIQRILVLAYLGTRQDVSDYDGIQRHCD